MITERHFLPFPTLHRLLWPAITNVLAKSPAVHPIAALVGSADLRVRAVADRTEIAMRKAQAENPTWLAAKIKSLTNDTDVANASGILGEIRAFGDLLHAWSNLKVRTGAGADFEVVSGSSTVRVEVNTPHHAAKRRQSDVETTRSRLLTIRTYSIFPFGAPERPEQDVVQGEAASKLASSKQEEHQFDATTVGILWLDLQDPTLWPLDFGSYEALPLSAFREELTSGALWHALYGVRGLPIFDALSMSGLPSRAYEMEFDGRFAKKSKIDFVVASTRTDHIVFENPRHTVTPDVSVYRRLHLLPGFNVELSWLDWPIQGVLHAEIEQSRRLIHAYRRAFSPE